MRLFIVWVILQKELLETLRDRKTIFRVFGLPVLIYPLLVLGVSKFQGSETEAREARSSRVALWGDAPAGLAAELGRGGKIDLHPWKGAPEALRRDLADGKLAPQSEPEDTGDTAEKANRARWIEPDNAVQDAARRAIGRREADAVLVLWPGFTAAMEGGREGNATVYFDSVRADSTKARERLERSLDLFRKKEVARREQANSLARGFATAARVRAYNVAPDRRKVGQILGGVMPFLLIGMSLLGALYPAIDLTAGEKERGTMQTLLCAPVRPLEIIVGKFLAVWLISLLMALANLVSLGATMARSLPGEVNVSPGAYALAFAMLIPVTFLVSAIFLSLAAFARDFKDGQNILIPVYLPLYLLAGITMLPGIELDRVTALVPVVNISLLIKASFLSEASPDLAFLTLGSSILYAGLALVLAARVFEREQVLLGGGSLRALFRFERRPGAVPSPSFALAAVSAILVIAFYAGMALSRLDKLAMVLAAQYGLFLVPTIGCALAFGFAVRPTFALRAPPIRSVAAALLLGPSTAIVVIALVQRVAPVPEKFAKALSEVLLLDGRPLWVLLAALAVTPAICEELLFRGLVFGGLRRLGAPAAILVSALLFAFAHGSIYRLAPTFALGAVLAYARHRSGSIVPGMVIHAINNGAAISLLFYKPAWLSAFDGPTMPAAVLAGATAVCAAGISLLRLTRVDEPAAPAGMIAY